MSEQTIMSDIRTRQEWLQDVSRSVDSLALRIVMDEDDGSPSTEELTAPNARVPGIGDLLAGIQKQAETAGCCGTAETACGLLRSLTDASAGPAFDEWLNNGVLSLQRALEAEGDAEPGTPAAPDPGPETRISPAADDKRAAAALFSLAQDPDLIADFILEAREHMSSVEAHMLAIEQDPGNLEPLHSAFRGFHTVKGLAGFLELGTIQQVAHEIETVLDLARTAQLTITPEVVDLVLAGADYLNLAILDVERALREQGAQSFPDHRPLIERIRRLLDRQKEAPASPGIEKLAEAAAEAVLPLREPAKRAAEEPVSESKAPAAAEPAAGTEVAGGSAVPSRAAVQSVKVDTAKLDHLVDMVGEMVIAQSLLRHDPDVASLRSPRLQRTISQLSRITTDVQHTTMSMRMVPIEGLFRRMSRLVRDLSRKGGKQVEFVLRGEDTELDRNIVEELADPLMHMVRNALDHGLEPPDERQAAGKGPQGRLSLSAYHQSGLIVIELSDDGRGLDRERILEKARQRGMIQGGDQISDNEAFNLIFEPGFSTAQKVTEVSGRGVGMDVVKRNITRLRGRIDIRSTKGNGATFFLKLPLTLAIIDALVVGVGKERYIIPISTVREMLRPEAEAVFTVENRAEMVMVRGSLLPMVRLYKRFGIAPRSEDPAQSLLIVSEAVGKRFCLMVDELIGKQEVVIKSLGEALKNIRGVAGGAILGDGHVGLILDVDGIFGAIADAH